MNNKKGFTLVELLAVIVVLALIALIGVPAISNVIESSKKGSNEVSAGNYKKALETAITARKMSSQNSDISDGTYEVMKDGNVCLGNLLEDECNGEVLEVSISGTKPTSGQIKIENGTITGIYNLQYGDDYLSFETESGNFVREDKWDGSTVTALENIEYDSITNTYTINNASDLAGIRDSINSGKLSSNYNIVLNSNINLGNYIWIPIGYSETEKGTYAEYDHIFSGVFDGNGYTIRGINVNVETTTDTVGFFGGVTGNTTIKNLYLEGNVSGNGSTVGGLIGFSYDTDQSNAIKIENCVIKLNVKGADATAGILARAINKGSLTINNCENYGNITGPGNVNNKGKVSGILSIYSYSPIIITNCKNYGSITNGTYTGGVLAYAGSTTGNVIKNCYNYGIIGISKDGDFSNHAGGILAYVNSSTMGGIIDSCYNNGKVSARLTAGGMLGSNASSNWTVENCVNYGEIISSGFSGGILGSGEIMGDSPIIVRNSSNSGKIVGDEFTGGIVGKGSGSFVIENSNNIGIITSNNSNAGGVCGYCYVPNANGNKKVEIINCSGGKATISSGKVSGRILGSTYNSSDAGYGTFITMSKNNDANDINVIGDIGGVSNNPTRVYFTGELPTWINGKPYSSAVNTPSWSRIINVIVYYNNNVKYQYLADGTNEWTVLP